MASERDTPPVRNPATFAPVEGGICPMGGKGSESCSKGMLVERPCNSTSEVELSYQTVTGGCGNCRFFLTGPDFLGEQVLELNRLMILMREESKEVASLSALAEDVQWDIDESTTDESKKSLSIKLTAIRAHIEGKKEALLPYMTAWSNRYSAIRQSIDLLVTESSADPSASDQQLTLLASEPSTLLQSVSEFELVRNTIEQARLLPRSAAPIPEQPASMLRGFMDAILASAGSTHLFARIPDKDAATTGASKLANMLAERLGDSEISEFLNDPGKQLPAGLQSFLLEESKSIAVELRQSINRRRKNRRLKSQPIIRGELHEQ